MHPCRHALEALPERRSQSALHAPGVEIWGRLWSPEKQAKSRCCPCVNIFSPVQPLSPALPQPKAAAPPPGSPLSTHRQPHRVSCCPARRVTHPHALATIPMARITQITWRPISSPVPSTPSRPWSLFLLLVSRFELPQRSLDFPPPEDRPGWRPLLASTRLLPAVYPRRHVITQCPACSALSVPWTYVLARHHRDPRAPRPESPVHLVWVVNFTET